MDITRTSKKSKVICTRVYESDYQSANTLTAELKQVITTTAIYPSKQIDSNLQDNPFGLDAFDIDTNEYESKETRVAWIDIPAGTTLAQMNNVLKSKKDCCLYKVLSSKPVLTDRQQYAIREGFRSMDEFANSQAVRHPETGELILDDNGNVQYRRVFYANSAKADVDSRTSEQDGIYVSPELHTELTGEMVDDQMIA